MNKIQILILLVVLGSWGCQSPKSEEPNQKDLTTIAFGSCTHQYDDEQLWPEITSENPALVILAGDNIYGDTDDMKAMKAMYDQQKHRKSYQQMLARTKVIGIWDDHDYGINDGGKHFSKKDSSKLLMLDFLNVPEDAAVRNHAGAYSSYALNDNDHRVKVILLDTRYFRDTLAADTSGGKRYLVNETGDILGDEQWAWLENELKTSDADVNIICSSIQVLPIEHRFEKWANFPTARNRLLTLIGETSPKNTLIISGDRHIAELSSMEIDGLNYPLYDFTASGLTHTWSEVWEEPNQYRVGDIIVEKNYGLITIDWNQQEVILEVKGHDRESYLTHQIDLN